MPQFNSWRSSFQSEGIDLAEAQSSDDSVASPSFWSTFQEDAATPSLVRDEASINAFSQASTPPAISSIPLSFQGANQGVRGVATADSFQVQTEPSQSLITALQTALGEEGQTRKPLVIPGSRKRALAAAAPPPPGKLFYPRWQLGFLALAATFFIALSLFSVAPITHGQSGAMVLRQAIALFGNNGTDNTAAIDAQIQQAQQQAAAAQQAPVVVSTSDYVQVARNAAVKCGIPPDAFVRQIQTESGFNPNAVSPAGAVGIAQFLPSTAAGLGFDPWDPVQALNGAACYMARLAASYNGSYAMALAAYNAGSGNVNAAVANCGNAWLSCLPAETQNYVTKIMG